VVKRPIIQRALNDLLHAEDGRSYIDLFSAHGAVFLGHAEPIIARAIAQQLDRIWLTGGLDTPLTSLAKTAVESFFPDDYALAALYSTGMEAAEFALRFARVTTGRTGVIGYENSMHGKSMATAFLGWDNGDSVDLPSIHRLPFLQRCAEAEILQQTEAALAGGSIGAVLVEPIQGCAGALAASAHFYREIARLTRQHHALLVVDEILTGFHRTGPAFCFMDLEIEPDVVLIGKTIGNGFPVSGVVANRRYALRPEMLPGSTYAGNPLACAAVTATLERLRAIDVVSRVAKIAQTIERHLGPLRSDMLKLRGNGALWMAELGTAQQAEDAALAIYQAGVCVGIAGRFIRLLPAATIEPANLEHGCAVIAGQLADIATRVNVSR
jgi:acetylornithine/succinyldiaminopimelate/putrescine aminotransferase